MPRQFAGVPHELRGEPRRQAPVSISGHSDFEPIRDSRRFPRACQGPSPANTGKVEDQIPNRLALTRWRRILTSRRAWSGGEISTRSTISRTRVPDSLTRSSCPCGYETPPGNCVSPFEGSVRSGVAQNQVQSKFCSIRSDRRRLTLMYFRENNI